MLISEAASSSSEPKSEKKCVFSSAVAEPLLGNDPVPLVPLTGNVAFGNVPKDVVTSGVGSAKQLYDANTSKAAHKFRRIFIFAKIFGRI